MVNESDDPENLIYAYMQIWGGSNKYGRGYSVTQERGMNRGKLLIEVLQLGNLSLFGLFTKVDSEHLHYTRKAIRGKVNEREKWKEERRENGKRNHMPSSGPC